MTSNQTHYDEYPVQCPSCSASEGFPRNVSGNGSGVVVLTLRCDGCRHVWTETRSVELNESYRTAVANDLATH